MIEVTVVKTIKGKKHPPLIVLDYGLLPLGTKHIGSEATVGYKMAQVFADTTQHVYQIRDHEGVDFKVGDVFCYLNPQHPIEGWVYDSVEGWCKFRGDAVDGKLPNAWDILVEGEIRVNDDRIEPAFRWQPSGTYGLYTELYPDAESFKRKLEVDIKHQAYLDTLLLVPYDNVDLIEEDKQGGTQLEIPFDD